MISIWEKESFITFDIILVGAGITGLSTAASLKEKEPSLNILVLEKGLLPTGASTKNAGFACFGSLSELQSDRNNLGDEDMLALVEKRHLGLQKTISRLGAVQIGLEMKGGYELLTENQSHYLEELEKTNTLLSPLFSKPVFTRKNELISTFGFDSVCHLVHNPFEGQLHTGKLISSLWQYCAQLGIKVITGAEVTHFTEEDKNIRVYTEELTFHCEKLICCTNAFSHQFPQIKEDLKPGRGLVMYVKPEKPVSFEGTFHYDEGYYYFRDFNGGIIFGGGRNLDFPTEETTAFGVNEKIETRLKQLLHEVIIPRQQFQIELIWSGIMAFGKDKSPIIKKCGKNCFIGIRLGGMGVAIGSMVGEELSELVLQS